MQQQKNNFTEISLVFYFTENELRAQLLYPDLQRAVLTLTFKLLDPSYQ